MRVPRIPVWKFHAILFREERVMISLWNEHEAKACGDDLLQLRVYTSRLLGRDPNMVLHGGGNTSVKIREKNHFGELEDILYVKGSGWDLATIGSAGFAPVRLDLLRRMADLEELTDAGMVRLQRAAMTDPDAPNPSVEAILHAIIPFRFVDHTHADAVVTVCNSRGGKERIEGIFGDRVLIIPYVMPGFVLARKIHELTVHTDWSGLEGIILMNHGVFAFSDEARTSYERMIRLVTEAEEYLEHQGAKLSLEPRGKAMENLPGLAAMRQAVCLARGSAVVARLDVDARSVVFSRLKDMRSIASRGPLTPDHVIRTKRIPAIIDEDPAADVAGYARAYREYFNRNTDDELTCLDPAPRWAVWPGHGIVCFGSSIREAGIISDIKAHTIDAIRRAEALGGWVALPERDIFGIEYWELEQAKLGGKGNPPVFQGKSALVTGAASGIGHACVEALCARGAAVMALDINPAIKRMFDQAEVIGRVCDVTDRNAVRKSVEVAIRQFGGLDILISNAGAFPASEDIADMQPETWNGSLNINLTSHQWLLRTCIPYLKLGMDPAVVFIASKNVPAPGPGASAYSVAKAGLTQLARIAAMELAEYGIRVNTLHPDAVFDTGIWTPEVLEKRAEHYGKTVQEYKTGNLLKAEISSLDVAELACTVAGPAFSKTTGAQIPIDGGNVRVI